MEQKLSGAELEIMKIIWASPERTALFSYIMQQLAASGRPCQKNTLIVLLARLVNKGFLRVRKLGRRNEYAALVSEGDYQTAQTRQFLDTVYQGSVRGLVANLVQSDLLTAEEYAALRQLLEQGDGGE